MYVVVIDRNNFVLIYLPTSFLINYIEIIYFNIIKQCNLINFALCNVWLKINDKSVLLFLYIAMRHCSSWNGNIGHTRHGTKTDKTSGFLNTHITHDDPRSAFPYDNLTNLQREGIIYLVYDIMMVSLMCLFKKTVTSIQ